MLFATSAIIPRFDFHQVVLHEARPDDCSSARSTAPLVEPGVYLEYTINKEKSRVKKRDTVRYLFTVNLNQIKNQWNILYLLAQILNQKHQIHRVLLHIYQIVYLQTGYILFP